jgi:hypothetical protein
MSCCISMLDGTLWREVATACISTEGVVNGWDETAATKKEATTLATRASADLSHYTGVQRSHMFKVRSIPLGILALAACSATCIGQTSPATLHTQTDTERLSLSLFNTSASSFGQPRKIELWVDSKKVGEQFQTSGPHAWFNPTGTTLHLVHTTQSCLRRISTVACRGPLSPLPSEKVQPAAHHHRPQSISAPQPAIPPSVRQCRLRRLRPSPGPLPIPNCGSMA